MIRMNNTEPKKFLLETNPKRVAAFVLVVLVAFFAVGRTETNSAPVSALMPHVEDFTQMWWADGFPTHSHSADWLRVIQTGSYALVLDTQRLHIPHFGAVPVAGGYDQRTSLHDRQWEQLPPAELALAIIVDGQTYRCTSGGTWSRNAGPRLIESGRFFQRSDVTDLVFTADNEQRLDVEARFETAAWPDRLALILAARPKRDALWRDAAMEIRLTTKRGTAERCWELPKDKTWTTDQWHKVWLSLDPVTFEASGDNTEVKVTATEIPNGESRPVEFDPVLGWHRVNLDGIEPIAPPGNRNPSNDAIERVKLRLSNPTDREQVVRLMFEKTSYGIRQRIGASITGVSAILRDDRGYPSGIPVQLSKNWHTKPEGGVYAGQWFHGISQVRLPPNLTVELELTLAYGHWGGVAAASHSQLCLVGWGGNQLWNQSALGAWGESICFDPDQVMANCTITDVRPLMVNSGERGRRWRWTSNVGGGDFFRLFDTEGKRIAHSAMRTIYHRHGPCLSEVSFAGKLGPGISHSSIISLSRTDDIVRGVYQMRMDVAEATDFSRFVVFQIGADTYSDTGEQKMAIGNESGLIQEWNTQWGGNTYRTAPFRCTDRLTWVSLHDAVARGSLIKGAWANRGIIIRSWKVQLGGKDATPWIAERGLTIDGRGSSTVDILPPTGHTQLEAGDFIEATIEHVVVPQSAKEYYGPNDGLRAALAKDENTWKMIYREAVGNDRHVEVCKGTIERIHPDIRVRTDADHAKFTVKGGLGYVPITFTGLSSHRGYAMTLDGNPVDQTVHGNDFWQTDYDPATRRWSRTYNLRLTGDRAHSVHFSRKP